MHPNEDSFMAELDNLNRRPDIIVLKETWLNSDTVDLYNIQGYLFCLSSTKISSLGEQSDIIGS